MHHRSVAVLAGTLLVATGLVGCTSSSEPFCEPMLGSGALTKNVSVLGGFGTEPTLSVNDDITIGGAQSLTIDRAKDRTRIANSDSVLTINYAIFEAANGTVIEASESFAGNTGHEFVPFFMDSQQGSFLDALQCAAPGDRVVVAFGPEEAESISGSIGAPAGTNIVAVVDVHEVIGLKLDGRTKNLPSGFPGVINNETGQPGVVIAPGKAPAEAKSATRIIGPGEVVSPEQSVVANFMQVTWDGNMIENTHDSSGPRLVGTSNEPIEGFRTALDGKTVGSQVVYLQPSAAGTADIFVIDILAAG